MLEKINKIFYKFDKWFYHLGLVLIGIAYVKIFNFWAIFYLILGTFLISFGHSLDDKKRIAIIYWTVILFLCIFLSLNQVLIILLLNALFFLYSKIQYYPISAFYKGFGWGLLFLIPIGSLSLWYFPISLTASVSEIFHEAHHFDDDKRDGRKTTAIWLNFKTTKETRKKVKIITICIGLLLILCLALL
jgi:hypothetical protein